MLEKLKESMDGCPVVKFGDYEYFVHPITDGIPLGDPEVLEEVTEAMISVANLDCDKIVTAESMGFPLATSLSLATGIPYVFIRKREYGLPGEISVKQVTGYSGSDMFINSIGEGDRVVFVDDVLSTGGTLRAIVQALRTLKAVLVDIVIVFNKNENKAELEKELDMRIHTLLDVRVRDGKTEYNQG
ncbi:MAG: purine phosphoribosyltransferase family protein [Thermoplasmata archaeon]|nr:purine phosphoribosyltransferase family protein [Thermoplasmata archaeon]